MGAALLLVSLAMLLFSINVPLTLTIFAALAVAFVIQFSAWWEARTENLDGTETSPPQSWMRPIRICGRHGGGKNLRQAGSGALRLTGLIEKNKSHLMAYLKRVTPIYGAYKTITLSVLAFILITGCVLLY